MIQLYGFAPLWGLIDISQPVMKVDVYLRLAKLPYKLLPFSMESFAAAPKASCLTSLTARRELPTLTSSLTTSRKSTAIPWTPDSVRLSGPPATR